jgi:hypothetical protein
MDHSADIHNVVSFFQAAFTFILALALTESFKQFVADRAEKEEDRHIHWDRLWSLISFLFLIIPFFQGMSRYYYVEYVDNKITAHYAIWLIFDGVAFLIEAALFFVMSRTLSPVLWQRFYLSVLALFVVDSVWALFSYETHHVPILPWLALNVTSIIVFTTLIYKFRAPRTACIAVVIRTILDYYVMWYFYFPPA